MKIVLIGAGNVGHHLGLRLHEVGEEVVQVFSRKKSKAKKLAEKINAKFTTAFDEIYPDAELYILAVHDDAIEDVSKKLISLGFSDKLIVHTSGATPQAIFQKNKAQRFGVFYPLQTFSPNRKPDFSEIPICVDANSKMDIELLIKLGKKLSSVVRHIPDKKRAVIHVAAVFVNNFANHLSYVANDILKENEIPFEILLPLMKETVSKLENGNPFEMQTGPAKRGDGKTIQRHLEFLNDFPEYAELYKVMTEGIANQKKK